MSMNRTVYLERISINRISSTNIEGQLDYIKKAAIRNKQYKLTASLSDKITEPTIIQTGSGEDRYRYSATLKILKKKIRTQEIAEQQLDKAIQNVVIATHTKQWRILEQKDDETKAIVDDKELQVSPEFVLPELSQDALDTFFSDIYERDAHIRLIYKAIETAINSNGEKRSHVLLYGEPACAKTSIFLAFQSFLGEQNLIILDATTMTKAGLEHWIINRARDGELPKFLCLEEIEKHKPENLLSLLSVLDNRAMLSRTNAISGNIAVKTNITIFATCNQIETLKNFHNGALYSRFQHRFECARPSKELMRKILEREVLNVQGNPDWIDKALELGYNIIPELTGEKFDPRQTISILLDGKDDLLNGKYESDLRKVYVV